MSSGNVGLKMDEVIGIDRLSSPTLAPSLDWSRLLLGLALLVLSGIFTPAEAAFGGKVENANGYDIIFTSDQAGSTQLAHQIDD